MGIEEKIPVINDPGERIDSILSDTPAVFEITRKKPDDYEDLSADFGTTSSLRRMFVQENHAAHVLIEYGSMVNKIAQEEQVDPRLLRAIMYVENYYNPDPPGANVIGENVFGTEPSFPPMHIREVWGNVLSIDGTFSPYEAQQSVRINPEDNIRAAAILVRRIDERIATEPGDDESDRVSKIASIYNYIGREHVNGYGEAVRDLYMQAAPIVDPEEIAELSKKNLDETAILHSNIRYY